MKVHPFDSNPNDDGPKDRAESIFHGALQLSPEQRPAYLDQACRGNARLRDEIERRIKAEETVGGHPTLPDTAGEMTVVAATLTGEKLGDRIGRYKILQQIGEGGCGVVYVAEQEEPVRRRVAVKVIKLGMDTKSVIARFEAERQALALMDHPNIARVLDAGATDTGRPYFVMELVRGVKITDYCNQNKLSTDDRLKLFIQVCHAIQHAHQKGIIHRDIKPSNILVTLHDGTPVPKVIDFGIAKATQGRLTDQTVYTAFEQFIGTPAYMSPEQAEMSGLDIDTRCDIYALGVLLYELLTGKTPFDAKELLASGIDKMRHRIREEEPPRPSTRVGTMVSADQTAMASHHRTSALKLISTLRGDLDWIVMKALEKDRTRRYETANAMALDIQRHRDNEEVLASPPSRVYQFQKLVQRNKGIFASIGAVTLALAVGLGLSLYMYVLEREDHLRAVKAEKEQARLRMDAEKRSEIGAKLTEAGLLMSREQFDEAERLVKELPPHPSTIAIFNTLGMVHARGGNFPRALTNFLQSTEVAPTNQVAYQYLAPLLVNSGYLDRYHSLRAQILERFGDKTDPLSCERMAQAALLTQPEPGDFKTINKMVEAAVANGRSSPYWDYFQFVKGLAEYRQGRFASAVEWLQKVVEHPDNVARTVSAYMVLAMAQHRAGQIDEALRSMEAGASLAREKPERAGSPDWHDNLTARLLTREAVGLIEGDGLVREKKK